MKYAILTLVLLLSFNGAYAAMSAEEKTKLQEEASSFQDENAKIREEHTTAIRDLRIEHIKKEYDLKIKNNHEVDALRKQMVVSDKESNEKIKAEIKAKEEAFKISQKKYNSDFQEKIIETKHQEFKAMMEKRRAEFKNSRKK